MVELDARLDKRGITFKWCPEYDIKLDQVKLHFLIFQECGI